MSMREQGRIGALADDAMRFIADNRERLIQAWLAETGCLPSESLLVEQRHSEKDGVVKMTVHVERKPAPVPGEHVVHLTVDATTPTSPERCYMPTENPDGTWTTKSPAPEPSAPPAGVPVCPKCGKPMVSHRFYNDGPATVACPAPGDPVTVATDPVSGDEVPTAEECAETVKRLGIDVPAWAADIRKRVAKVATGGVPVVAQPSMSPEAGEPTAGVSNSESSAAWRQPGVPVCLSTCGRPAWCTVGCASASKSLHPARSVPPVPVPVEAPRGCQEFPPCEEGTCRCRPIRPPAAPASEPGVRPLLWVRMGQYRPGGAPPSAYKAFCDEVWTLEVEKVPRLEAKYNAARAEVEQLRGKLADADHLSTIRGDALQDACTEVEQLRAMALHHQTDAIAVHAEVEQLRAKLAEVEKEAREWQEAAVGNEQTADERVLAAEDKATARVRSMREAAAKVAEADFCPGTAGRIRALPLDTGTATDGPTKPETGGAR